MPQIFFSPKDNLPILNPHSIYCQPSPQHLSHSPSLSRAAPRRVGGVALKNFAQTANSAGPYMMCHRFEEFARLCWVFVYVPVRHHKRANQPAPSCALVVGAVALQLVASVCAAILRGLRREAAEADRSQKLLSAAVQPAALLDGRQ